MSTLKEQAAIDIDMFMETGLPWIDTVVFVPQVGDPVTLNVIFEQEEFSSPDGYQTSVAGIQYRVEMLIKDIGRTPVAAAGTLKGDYFIKNDVKYEVTEIAQRDNQFIVCSVKQRD